VPEDIKEALKDTGTISCSFYFLNDPKPNHKLRGARKSMEELPTVDEKAVKGDALSHQATYVAGKISTASTTLTQFQFQYRRACRRS
jgi:hypothetical protein